MKSCKKVSAKRSSEKAGANPKAKKLVSGLRSLQIPTFSAAANLWSGLPYRRVIE